ncbi:c-type cytochrome [Microvirga makkahensis]|uniref:C-type cytochrome n=1 Tax=Microvirga makkahensis TaxID=1128670 RepID=A0A7X3MW49_9HYPH|nr:c-type cytochrome [Microvirga makkahensis]MXQ14317.1 c-type cytochrome [Microvirga makkahensis]
MPRFLIRFALAPATGMLLLAIGYAQDGQVPDPAVVHPSGTDVERGRAIVVAAAGVGPSGACFQCHGMDGEGDAAAAFPRLSGQVYKYLYDSMKDYASGARQNPIMTPIAQSLSEQQIRDVSAYYAAQEQAPFVSPEAADPRLLQHGGALAAIGSSERGIQGCINCHGPAGAGLPPTYPYLAGQYAMYMEAQLNAWKGGTRKSDRLSAVAMEDIAKRMTDEDIRAVSIYYASIRPQTVTPERLQAASPMVPSPPGAVQRPNAR